MKKRSREISKNSHYSLLITLAILFILGLAVSLYDKDNNQLTSLPVRYGDTVPQGYGVPWNLFSSQHENLLDSSSNIITAKADYVYKYGYVWDFNINQWKRFEFPRGSSPYPLWVRGSASYDLSSLGLPSGEYSVVAYTCQKVNNEWKCGCRTSRCRSGVDGGMWQVQRARLGEAQELIYLDLDHERGPPNLVFLPSFSRESYIVNFPLYFNLAIHNSRFTSFETSSGILEFKVYSSFKASDVDWELFMQKDEDSSILLEPAALTEDTVSFIIPDISSNGITNILFSNLILDVSPILNKNRNLLANKVLMVSIEEDSLSFDQPVQVTSNRIHFSPIAFVLPSTRSLEQEIIAGVISDAVRVLPSEIDVAEVIFQLFSPNFYDIASAAAQANIPATDIINTFKDSGYLRQGVRAVMQEGINSAFVLQGLHDAGIGIDQVRQLRNEFSLSDSEFRRLVAQAGYNIEGSRFSQPQGIRINSYPDQIYRSIRFKAVYTYSPGTRPLVGNWENEIRNILEEVSRFYKRELRDAVTVSYDIYPRPIEIASNSESSLSSLREVEVFTRVIEEGGDLYIPFFSNQRNNDEYDILVIFTDYRDPEFGGYGSPKFISNEGISHASATNFGFNTQEPNILKYLVAHEVGHALGFPHTWNVLRSPDISVGRGSGGTGLFRSIPGNVMGYDRGSNFDTAFLTDDITNMILLGETSSLSSEETLHVDSAPFKGSTSSIADISAYVTRNREAGIHDSHIIEQLLASGVSPANVIRSYEGLENGVVRLIEATLVKEGVSLESVFISFKEAGFNRENMLRLLPFFFSSGINQDDLFWRTFNKVFG